MKSLKRILSFIAIIFLLTPSLNASAQCAMCRASAESSIKKNESKVGRGLNHGILYLMSVPYLLGGVAAFIYFKNRKKD
ncbi:MAG TPA: hypothetical protein VJY62_07910 [Bacteroidia bacterium]|nr:hypothetical protein [Bacteroidia bacterium]